MDDNITLSDFMDGRVPPMGMAVTEVPGAPQGVFNDLCISRNRRLFVLRRPDKTKPTGWETRIFRVRPEHWLLCAEYLAGKYAVSWIVIDTQPSKSLIRFCKSKGLGLCRE